MKIQRPHTFFFLSLCSALGMLGLLIFTLGIDPEELDPRMVWNGKDVASRLTIFSKWDGKVPEKVSVVKVIKKDKGTVITVRSYGSGASNNLFYRAKLPSDSYERWQREALRCQRNGRERSEIGESGERWGAGLSAIGALCLFQMGIPA